MKLPVWIDERDALTLHDRLLALQRPRYSRRGPAQVRSRARPLQHYAYGDSAGIVDLAAIYTAGILRNHPFVDGNKRTGFLPGTLFLEINGYRFTTREEEAAQAVLALAAGDLIRHDPLFSPK